MRHLTTLSLPFHETEIENYFPPVIYQERCLEEKQVSPVKGFKGLFLDLGL